MRSKLSLAPFILNYKTTRTLHLQPTMPISVTCSVTNRCNSRCLTCNIWKFYLDTPELQQQEFSADEFDRTFQSIGSSPFWITISGGEPFLRDDLDTICESASTHCHPAIINIPTNGLLPTTIQSTTQKILEKCPNTSIILNLSLDGIEAQHDTIRQVPGNFTKLLTTFTLLKGLQQQFPTLEVGLHSVVSKYSIHHLLDTYEYIKKLEPDSYITEVAEERSELSTKNTDITPPSDEYTRFITELSKRMRADTTAKRKVSKTTRAFRLIYYEIAAKTLQEKRQIIPCYAGYASCQITPMGDVWPCCSLGYDATMGNLRTENYDFKQIWHSQKAKAIRNTIRARTCHCPLANAHYTSMLCSPSALLQVLLT